MDIKWQCYIETEMGYQLVSESFPSRFNRNDVTRAFEGRYNTKVLQVNPISCYPSQSQEMNSETAHHY